MHGNENAADGCSSSHGVATAKSKATRKLLLDGAIYLSSSGLWYEIMNLIQIYIYIIGQIEELACLCRDKIQSKLTHQIVGGSCLDLK